MKKLKDSCLVFDRRSFDKHVEPTLPSFNLKTSKFKLENGVSFAGI